VRVLVVGQDPYPTPGHPVGLSFSVAPEVRPLPPSLVNIFAELQTDLGVPRPSTGDLTPWADRGVLLLNRVLTVGPGKPGSHRGRGWEDVTAAAIAALVARGGPLVAILWGSRCALARPGARGRRPHRERPSLAPVGPLRLLRIAAVQSRQRPARGSRRRAH
jgi:uracil-DNA glycosylase